VRLKQLVTKGCDKRLFRRRFDPARQDGTEQRMQRRGFLIGGGLSAMSGTLCPARRAWTAAGFPDHSLTLLAPFNPGTRAGLIAMLLGPYLADALGKPVTVLPITGEIGDVGHEQGGSAPADGYTLTLVSQSLCVQHWIVFTSRAVPDNFTFVGQVTSIPTVLLVRADSGYRNLDDLVRRMLADPDTIRTGGRPNWWPASALARALFCERAGIRARIDEGYSRELDLIIALEQGQLDFAVVGADELRMPPERYRLRALAVSTARDSGWLPGVPTFRQQGWDITIGWWHGIGVPRETDPDIVAVLGGALSHALADPGLRAAFLGSRLSIDPMNGTTMRRRVIAEDRMIGQLFTYLGKNIRARSDL
jgi:tripartite-type tricarboxylate transporter receptor subunit TctC